MGILSKCFVFSDSKQTSSSLYANKYSTQIEELCHRFSLAQLRKSTNNFDGSRMIGSGDFGKVYKGNICIQGVAKEIALKRFESNHSKVVSEFYTEIELLCQLHHPNLVSLIGFCCEKDGNISVYEYVANGSLAYHLFDNRGEPLSWKRRVEICIGVARVLHYLHAGVKRTIFHRDIKPNNILLDQNWIPKLADFGISLIGPHSMSKPRPLTRVEVAGTDGYIAPECIISNTLTEKCDVYSFGMVLLVVVCAKDPRSILEKMKHPKNQDVNKGGSECESYKNLALLVYNFVHEGKADGIVDPLLTGKIAPMCWKIFIDIAVRCLLFEPNERPAMGEVEMELEHALALQEEADHVNPCGDYSLLSTVITPQLESVNQNQGFSAN